MRFFEDTHEIEYQMDVLREDIKAGVIKESIPFLDLVASALKTHVEGFRNKDDLWLFSQCRTCSDALDSRRHCSFDDTRAAIDALSSLLLLKEGAALAVPEDQESLLSQVDDLERRLKNVLLYKFQGPSVAASILRSKRRTPSKKKEAIFAFACDCLEKFGAGVTPAQCWASFGEDEDWPYRDKNGNAMAVWVDGDKICQSVSGRDAGEITQNSFRKYLTEARKTLNVDKK